MFSKSEELKKTINLSRGISLTVGSIIGSGLLALPGIAYVKYGSASLVAWATTALLVLPFAFIFSNLSSKFPSAGGIYEFSKKAFGDRISQIVAFIIAGTWPIGIPILALIGSNYVVRVFFMPEYLVPIVAFIMLLTRIDPKLFWRRCERKHSESGSNSDSPPTFFRCAYRNSKSFSN